MIVRFSALLALLVASGCQTSTEYDFTQCSLEFSLVETEAAPGDVLTLTGERISEAYDLYADLGGQRTAIVEVLREDCGTCDACEEAFDNCATSCTRCTDCEALCADCTESLTLRVPDLPPGPTRLVVFSNRGQSEPLVVEILAADTGDTGTDTGDTGTDTGDTGTDTGDTGTDTGDTGTDTGDTGTDTGDTADSSTDEGERGRSARAEMEGPDRYLDCAVDDAGL